MEAKVLTPRSPLPGEDEDWEEVIVRTVAIEVRDEAKRIAAAARRLAAADRLFSAVMVLERLGALPTVG